MTVFFYCGFLNFRNTGGVRCWTGMPFSTFNLKISSLILRDTDVLVTNEKYWFLMKSAKLNRIRIFYLAYSCKIRVQTCRIPCYFFRIIEIAKKGIIFVKFQENSTNCFTWVSDILSFFQRLIRKGHSDQILAQHRWLPHIFLPLKFAHGVNRHNPLQTP